MKYKTQILLILVILVFGIFFFRVLNHDKKSSLGSDLPNASGIDKILCLDMIDVDGKQVKLSHDESIENSISLIFVFSRPCLPCNNNLFFWNKISKINTGNFKVYGVIRSDIDELNS